MTTHGVIDEWRWWITDPGTGLRGQSSEFMTEAQARALDRSAQPIRGTHRERALAEGLHTVAAEGRGVQAWSESPSA